MKKSDAAKKLLHGGHIQFGVENYLKYKRRSNIVSTWASEAGIYVAANLLETAIWTFSLVDGHNILLACQLLV